MRLVTSIFDRHRFLVLAAAACAALGCTGTSPAANPNPDGTFDATAPDDAAAPDDAGAPDGGSTEASPVVDAGLDAMMADEAMPDATVVDASTDGAIEGAAPEAGPSGIDAGDAGGDAGSALDAGGDAAGGDAAGAPDAGHPTFTSIYSDIIVPNCASCHAQPPPIESMLEMRTQEEAYSNLVGVVAMGDACGGNAPDGGPPPIRVIPGDSADSLLYMKVTFTQKCGSGMPADADELSADELLAIKTWIDQGAANN